MGKNIFPTLRWKRVLMWALIFGTGWLLLQVLSGPAVTPQPMVEGAVTVITVADNNTYVVSARHAVFEVHVEDGVVSTGWSEVCDANDTSLQIVIGERPVTCQYIGRYKVLGPQLIQVEVPVEEGWFWIWRVH